MELIVLLTNVCFPGLYWLFFASSVVNCCLIAWFVIGPLVRRHLGRVDI